MREVVITEIAKRLIRLLQLFVQPEGLHREVGDRVCETPTHVAPTFPIRDDLCPEEGKSSLGFDDLLAERREPVTLRTNLRIDIDAHVLSRQSSLSQSYQIRSAIL